MNSGIDYNKASDIGWKLSQGIEYSLKHKKFDENYFSTPSVTRSDFFCFTLISIVQKCSLMDIGQVSTSALRVWYNFFSVYSMTGSGRANNVNEMHQKSSLSCNP